MKYVTILFLLTITLFSYAQSGYISFPSDSAEWFVEIKGPNGGNKGTTGKTQKIRYFVTGDTVINDTSYIPIYEERDGYINSWYYLYQDSIKKKVYFKELHWEEGVLLFDFGLNVGDYFDDYRLGALEVQRVDTIVIDGLARRRIVFNQLFYIDPNVTEYYFIEGIGSNAGLFYEDYLGILTSMLTCFRVKGNSVYPTVIQEHGCDLHNYVYTTIADNSIPKYDVFPSPITDFIGIKSRYSEGSLVNVTIYNLLGVKVYSNALDLMGEELINLSKIESGIYLLLLINENKIIFRKKLIKL